MKRSSQLAWRAMLLAALLPGCTALTASFAGSVDTAQLPPGEFASADPDIEAVTYASEAFSNQASTYGDPAAGAEAVLALEYSAGALNNEPRWAGLSPDIKAGMIRGRIAVRDVLGVTSDASSQSVVNALSAARRALQIEDRPAALAALRSPVFTLGPDKTLELLGNLPYLQPVNVATLQAVEAVSGVAPQAPLSTGMVSY